MKENMIITLENGSRYLLNGKINNNNEVFYLAVGLSDINEINYQDICILKEIKEDNDTYVIKVNKNNQMYYNTIITLYLENEIEKNPQEQDKIIDSVRKSIDYYLK